MKARRIKNLVLGSALAGMLAVGYAAIPASASTPAVYKGSATTRTVDRDDHQRFDRDRRDDRQRFDRDDQWLWNRDNQHITLQDIQRYNRDGHQFYVQRVDPNCR